MLSDCWAVRLAESVAFAVKENVPNCVGVPEIAPVLEFSDSPPGKEPELTVQLYGVVPPVACRIVE